MKKLLLTITLFSLLVIPSSTSAQIAGENGLLTGVSSQCLDTGDCQICDTIFIINNVVSLILGVTGSLALISFVVAGIYLMASGVEASYRSKAVGSFATSK